MGAESHEMPAVPVTRPLVKNRILFPGIRSPRSRQPEIPKSRLTDSAC